MPDFYETTRTKLYNEIWTITTTRFARKNNISYENIRKTCERHNIPMPSVEYWRDKKRGKSPEIPALTPAITENISLPYIKHKRKYFDLSSKANTVCILKILEQYSDEKKPLSISKIIELMERIYSLSIGRATVYDSIEILRKIGYSISSYSDNKQGYYLTEREFHSYEIQMILDSIAMNPFIPDKIEKEIIYKLKKRIVNPNFKSHHIVRGIRKHNDKYQNFYFNLDQIENAIVNDKKLSFNYGERSSSRELLQCDSKTFTLTPHSIIANQSKYLLSCIAQNGTDEILFNIENIIDPVVIDEKGTKSPNSFLHTYSADNDDNSEIKNCLLKIRCNNDIIDEAIKFFGKEIKTSVKQNDKNFDILKKCDYEQAKIWCLKHICNCEVIEPIELREEIIGIIKNNIYDI